MLLTITTTYTPATDLGYLLHKHPAHVQAFGLNFGQAYVYYPEATEARCTAALLLDVDPVGLVRKRGRESLADYVSDRPYAASSFMSVAMAEVYGTALSGRCKSLPELVATPIPLQAEIVVLPCKGGSELLHRLFEPLGYELETESVPPDEQFPDWGESPYYHVKLKATCMLRDLLRHIYVLVPVLDNEKHYYVGKAEIDKLLRHGQEWLGTHPERDLITRRYLRYKPLLTREALARLADESDPDPDERVMLQAQEEQEIEKPIRLSEQRIGAVTAVLKGFGARRVLDLGCGEGALLKALMQESQFEKLIGMDVSVRALQIAGQKLRIEKLPERQRDKIRLLQGSLLYRDDRLRGYDAAVAMEVVEHLEPDRLHTFEQVLFGSTKPGMVIITTPNVEYNALFGMPAGKLRHRDHRFEWTRAEFQVWAENVARRFGYKVHFVPVGTEDAERGSPTQMGVFEKA